MKYLKVSTLIILALILTLLSSCDEKYKGETNTLIITGKIENKYTNQKEIGNSIYYIDVITILEEYKQVIKIQVMDENLWNLIQKDEFYRISFNNSEDDKILNTIESIQINEEYFDNTFEDVK